MKMEAVCFCTMFVAAYQTRAQWHDADNVSKKCGFICLIHIQRDLRILYSPFLPKGSTSNWNWRILGENFSLDREKFYHNFTRRTSWALYAWAYLSLFCACTFEFFLFACTCPNALQMIYVFPVSYQQIYNLFTVSVMLCRRDVNRIKWKPKTIWNTNS
jgi:hypothetical protein